MIFTTPSYIPNLPFPPPDSLPIHEFLFGEDSSRQYGRYPLEESEAPFTCGITGKSYAAKEVATRIDFLAKSLSEELKWRVNDGNVMEKVLGIFSLNSIDNLTVSWATHRLNGVSCPISATYSMSELTHQFRTTECKALFTCVPLLDIALAAASAAGIPRHHVYLLEVPETSMNGKTAPPDLVFLDQLISRGRALSSKEPLDAIQWEDSQGARQPAFLCASSGTSGLPKNVMLSHRNVISNMLMTATFDSTYHPPSAPRELSLGILPQSHIYALVVLSHSMLFRGDGIVVLQRFDLLETLAAIQRFRIERLWLVPAMVVAINKAKSMVKRYDLSCVRIAAVGASALTEEVFALFSKVLPKCKTVIQGYGLTEGSAIVSFNNAHDSLLGSCGHLYPGLEARLIDEEGRDVNPEYGQAGELVLRGPSVSLGYFQNDVATKEMFTTDGWMRTGDLMEMRKSAKGHDHLFMVDRVKELIKVNGMQIAPAELENFLLLHPAVADVCVVPIPDASSGELPLAYVVIAASYGDSRGSLRTQLLESVSESLSQHKRLAGGIEFVDALPKTASGKTQRKVLKEKAREQAEARQRTIKQPVHAQNANRTKRNGTGDEKMAFPRRPVVLQVIEFGSDSEDD